MEKRKSFLDIIKGIGIILVVIGHVYSNATVSYWIYSFHMPLFFFAGGWLYKRRNIVLDIVRRIQTVVVPYLCFGTITLVYWQLIERKFRSSDLSFVDSVLGFLLGKYDQLDFNQHLWFLPSYFIVTVLFNAIVVMGRKYGKQLALIVSLVMSVIYVLIPLPSLPWGIDRAFRFIGFYAMGMLFSTFHIDEKATKAGKGILLLFAIISISINYLLASHFECSGIMWFVTATFGVFSMLLLSLCIEHNRLLEYLGLVSLGVLCIHGPVYRVLVKLISIPLHLETNETRENALLALCVVLITICICVIMYNVIKKLLPWMVGKRKQKG